MKKIAIVIGGIIGGSIVVMGLFAVITEWRSINSTKWYKVKYLFSFPVFMLTWIPIGLVALFKKVQWAPIPHKVGKGIDEIKNQNNK